MSLGPGDVGHRVVLRHRLPDGRATDLLGELLAWGDVPPGEAGETGEAVVATARGPVRVPLEDILLGKRVPPAPPARPRRQIPLLALHDVMADGWQPLESTRLGEWRLRAAGGFTGRANSVLPLGSPLRPLPAAVDAVEEWYAERGLPSRFCVPWPLGSGPGDAAYGSDPLEAELVRRGYDLDSPTLVMTCSLTAGLLAEGRFSGADPASGSAFGEHVLSGAGLTVDVRAEPDPGWLGLYHYRGQELPSVATQVLTSAPAQAFVSIRGDESDESDEGDGHTSVRAVGRVASSRGWSGITAVEVDPAYRRQGLARLVMAALLRWASEQGDTSAYLQVMRSNAAARALYDELGFTAHSGYHYRIRS